MKKHSESRKNFARILVDESVITADQLKEAVQFQKEKGCSLNEAILHLGYIDEKRLLHLFSAYLSTPPLKVLNLVLPPEILKLVPQEIALQHQVLPIGRIENVLTVAMADPLNVVALDDLERITGCEVNPVVALRSEIQEAIEKHYRKSIVDTVEEIMKDSSDIKSIEVIKEEKEEVRDEEILRSIEEAPVIKLTNYILKKSVEETASDILIESLTKLARVRFRVDGVLKEVQTFSREMHNFVVSRIKVIANLNITEHRLPQDGRFRMNILGREIDFRVSIMPSALGEKVALRVLDKSQGLLAINNLGFEEHINARLKDDAASSYGMILACGPTGCGKTTTLYAILREIYTPEKNIITVEDPIEYQLAGINQVNVNYEVGLTFASALRSMLRQDPDIIMVGEIRDFDTVDIAIKAALTGHLVLSTLHTTTAPGSVTRLINIGVEPFLLSSTLIGVLAERLVRKLCPRCKEELQASEGIKEKYKIPKSTALFKPKGCKSCLFQGYLGRVALGEYLRMDAEVKKAVNFSRDEGAIRKVAKERGMRFLRENGLEKVKKGITSLEEILKATAETEM
ncbi:MAG: Flp pilus assembly complex ATPase component TadA [Candidatus Omnitrophota bacterium]|nr:MAG: Flp pilus assembly complex ATPase component TadA [Candidatus Omnitrophota bacterium]